jgi:rsbT co-antagonist protein RsbR
MPRKHTTDAGDQPAELSLTLAKFSIESASDEVIWSDPAARVVYANQAACRSLGYSRDEMLSLSIPDFDPDFPASSWPSHWADLKQRGSLTFESRHRAKDGRVFPVEIAANFLEYAGREYNIAHIRDISERKRAGEKLRESEERYRMVVEDQTEFVVRWLPDGTRTFVNNSFCRFLNTTAAELVGDNVNNRLDPDQQEKLRRVIGALTPEKPTATHVFELFGAGGSLYQVEWTNHGLFDEHRQLKELQSVGRDITEQKRAEAELARQQEMIRELSTPVLPISEGLLILPLIGSIDTVRARQMTEQLLRSVRTNRARVVVIDVTGVATIDTAVANHLIQLAEAARLLGAQIILTGISRDIAQTLVSLGVNLGALRTVGDLRRGIEEAQLLLKMLFPKGASK